MKLLLIISSLIFLPFCRATAQNGLTTITSGTDTVKAEEPVEEDDAQGYIQEADEDLAGFVEDYITKEIALKNSFFLEDSVTKKILKLTLDTVSQKTTEGPDNSKIIEAIFNCTDKTKRTALFYLRSAGFAGMDIFRLELKKAEKPASKKKPVPSKSGAK